MRCPARSSGRWRWRRLRPGSSAWTTELQERLINWGYAVCDAALRKHVDQALRKPDGFPYPAAKV